MKVRIIATLLACMVLLSVSLAACGGGSSGGTPEEQLEHYNAAYDQISDEDTLSNPNKLTYSYICDAMGDKGEWVTLDEETDTWVVLDGTPEPGEEATLRYSIEGIEGSILVLWAEGKDYETEGFSSISNTF